MWRRFVTSSRMPLPDSALYGFAFSEADLVLGESGRLAQQRNGGVIPGSDGAYIVVSRSDEGVLIGTDAAGYRWLFLYRCSEGWVLGDSFFLVAETAASYGWPITPDRAQLNWLAGENLTFPPF